jgi:hypothetical protein
MMKHFVELGLFEAHANGLITCMKVAKRLSASATSNQYMRKIIHSINTNNDLQLPSCHRHDVVMKEENRIEEKKVIKTSIPDNFSVSERVIKWANEKGYRDLNKHLDNFILVAQSNNYKYTDWDAAFMRAIKDNWAKVANKEVRLSL